MLVAPVRLVVEHDQPFELRDEPQRRAQHRIEVEIAVGDVQDQEPVVFQLGGVEAQRLRRQEMHRHRIGSEGIDDDQIEALVRLFRQRSPRVPDDDVGVGQAVGEKREVVGFGRDVDNGGIDFEIAPLLAFARKATERAGAQPDDSEPPALALGVEVVLRDAHGARERASRIVVGDGRRIGDEVAVLAADALRPVQGGAVGQHVELAVLRLHDAIDAVVAALRDTAFARPRAD